MKKVYCVLKDTYGKEVAFACENEEVAKVLSLDIWGESKAEVMVQEIDLIDDKPFIADSFKTTFQPKFRGHQPDMKHGGTDD